MSRTKYAFDAELKPYAKLYAPVNPLISRLLQKPMDALYVLERSDAAVCVARYRIPTGDGAHLRALIYAPTQVSEPVPCILFLHGGGFVFNAAPHHFTLARRFAAELHIKVLLVDYRLAPKYVFPTAHADCLLAYHWLLTHAEALGADANSLLVCGDSAGGNLATALCLMAMDAGLPLPRAQLLFYPFLDRRLNTESCVRYTDTPMCNSQDMHKYLKMYAKNTNAARLAYLSPAEAPSLAKMPPAYIEIAQYDCLHDEGVAYAQALRRAGTPAELHEIRAAMHGYDIAQRSKLMQKIMATRADFINRVIAK